MKIPEQEIVIKTTQQQRTERTALVVLPVDVLFNAAADAIRDNSKKLYGDKTPMNVWSAQLTLRELAERVKILTADKK